MVYRNCKICNSEYREQLETFILQGFSDSYCVDWLKERDIKITVHQIKNHIIKHTQMSVTLEDTDRKEGIQQKTERINAESDSLKINLPTIPENITFEELVSWVQGSIGRIFIKQCTIVEQSQNLYVEGQIKHPTEQIRALKYLSDVLDLAWAYKPGVDLTRAISVIESEGFSIVDERAKVDEEVERDINTSPTKSANIKEE
jgi:hypothetical protein